MLTGNRQFFLFLIFIIRWPAPTWGAASAPPPASSRRSLYRLLKKFRNKGSLQDLRKRRPSSREGVEEVCNDDMVDEVRAQLDIESARKADQVGSSKRRNPFYVRSVLKMKDKARACVAVGGGHFEGRKV